jgi:hypothetical protein
MQRDDENGDGGDGTQICDDAQPPLTAVGWQARAVSAHADAAIVDVGIGVQLPPCTRGSIPIADAALMQPVPTQRPASASSPHASPEQSVVG